MKVYLNPKVCNPCKYRNQFRLLGRYCQENGIKMQIINQNPSEATQTLPYVEINGKTQPLIQMNAQKLSEMIQ